LPPVIVKPMPKRDAADNVSAVVLVVPDDVTVPIFARAKTQYAAPVDGAVMAAAPIPMPPTTGVGHAVHELDDAAPRLYEFVGHATALAVPPVQ